jgi:integrase/recombinase XerD
MNPITETIKTYLSHCEREKRFSYHTIKAYKLDLIGFSSFLAERGFVDIAKLSKNEIPEYLRSLSDFRPRTQRRRLATAKSFFGYLHREGHLDINPAQSVRMEIRMDRILPRAIGLSKIQALLRASYDMMINDCSDNALRDIALLELMFASGMRVSEISDLRLDSLDLSAGCVLIRGKGQKERIIPICDEEVLTVLRRYEERRKSLHVQTDLFFSNRTGERLSEQSIRIILCRVARKAGIGKLTPHMLRHTVATLVLDQGVDLRFIQHFLGHSSIVTTTIYVCVAAGSQRAVLTTRHPRKLLGKFLKPSPRNEG